VGKKKEGELTMGSYKVKFKKENKSPYNQWGPGTGGSKVG